VFHRIKEPIPPHSPRINLASHLPFSATPNCMYVDHVRNAAPSRRGISLAYHIHGFLNVTIHPHRSNGTERNDLPKQHKYGRCTQTHNAPNRLRKQPAQLVYTYMLPHFRVPIVPRHTFQRSTICNALPSSCSATSLAW
jgi:hypothetical protein